MGLQSCVRLCYRSYATPAGQRPEKGEPERAARRSDAESPVTRQPVPPLAPGTGLAQARPRGRRAVTVGVGAIVLAALLAVFAVARPFVDDADAAAFGCGGPPAARSLFGAVFDIDVSWSLGPDTGSAAIDVADPIEGDRDGDGIPDSYVEVPLDLDGDGADDTSLLMILVAGATDLGGGEYRYDAVSEFVENSHAYEVIRDGNGLDYADQVISPIAPDGLPPMTLDFLLVSNIPDPDWAPGTFEVSAGVTYIDGTVDRYEATFDTTDADISASDATSVWPPVLHVSIFNDDDIFDTLAVSLSAYSDGLTFQPIATSDMGVDILVDTVNDEDLNDELHLVAHGALAEDAAGNVTSAGLPGTIGLASVDLCDALPFESWVGLGHGGAALGLPAPVSIDADASLYGAGDVDGDGVFEPDGERTFYVDASLTEPPTVIGATIGSNNADIDGDGDLDGLDLDVVDDGADGIPDDRLPWQYVEVAHDGTTSPGLHLVLAREPEDPGDAPLYLAADLSDLPKTVSFDRAGIPRIVDANGDGVADDLNFNGVVDAGDVPVPSSLGALAGCARDWSTYPAVCSAVPQAIGKVELAYADTIPTPLGDGTLPYDAATFPVAPADIQATTAGHFQTTPPDWVTADLSTTMSIDGAGQAVVTHELDEVHALFRGLQAIRWDLTTDTRITAQTSGLGRFGMQVSDVNHVTGASQRAWSVLADAPKFVTVIADTEPENVDLDPYEVQWNTGSGRTGAAVAIDTNQPTGDQRAMAVSAWVGTLAGGSNGLPPGGRVVVDLHSSSKQISFVGPGVGGAPTRLEIGFTTSTRAQRLEQLATRGRVFVGIPDDFTFQWTEDAQNLTTANLSTCAGGATCPVTNLLATVVNTTWIGLGHDALGGVDMVPVPDADGAEFPDFTAYPEQGGYYADWVHGVWRDDPSSSASGQPVIDLLDTWGLDINLSAISTGRLNRFAMIDDHGDEAFTQTNFCFDGRTRTADLGLGLYEDEGGEKGATWFDGNLQRVFFDLRLTASMVTPDTDGGGTIGDLTDDQLDLMEGKPEDFDLVDVQMTGCSGIQLEDEKTLIGRMRRGTEGDIAEVLDLGAQSRLNGRSGIPEPVENGADVAFYVAKDDEQTVYQGLDAGFHIPVWESLALRQPVYLRCGTGSQPFPACHDLPTYDTTTRSDVAFELVSPGDGVLGDLDLEYLAEPVDGNVDTQVSCSPDRFGDDCALRTVLHVAQVPSHLTIDGSLVQRARDGFIDVDLTIANGAKDPEIELFGLDFQYRDDYRPARLGDATEGGPNFQPVAWLELENVGKTLTIDGIVWTPRYGWPATAYDTDDCQGWTPPSQDDHIFPYGDDPSTWTTEGPRPDGLLRRAYVHATLDLNPDFDQQPAEIVEIDVDNRVDEAGEYEHAPTGALGRNWYDDTVRMPIKVGLDTGGEPSEGELWALSPGLRQHGESDGLSDGEVCMDIDVPVHVEWEAASNLRVGVDDVKLTLSMLDSEVNGGADATVAFEERLSPSLLSNNTVTGVWVHELKTWYNPPLKNWYTGIEDERMSIAFLDPDDLKLEVLLRDEFGVQGTFKNGWAEQGTTSGGRYYGEVLLQAFFHEDVEAELSLDNGIPDALDAWTGFWNRLDESTERISSWTYPRLDGNAAFDAGAVAYDNVTIKNCAQDEVNAIGATFAAGGTASDGTHFEIGARWNNDRVEVFLIGKYDNGQIRFVRELYDGDPGQKTCKLDIDGSIAVDPESGRVEVVFDVEGTAKDNPAPNDWFAITDDTFVFDLSGNGWVEGLLLDNLVGFHAGEQLTLSGGTLPSVGEDCVWYPGDGSRIAPTDNDNHANTATHTYAFPGEYHVMQLCYDEADPTHPEVEEITLTIL